jgi:hypothetical protein
MYIFTKKKSFFIQNFNKNHFKIFCAFVIYNNTACRKIKISPIKLINVNSFFFILDCNNLLFSFPILHFDHFIPFFILVLGISNIITRLFFLLTQLSGKDIKRKLVQLKNLIWNLFLENVQKKFFLKGSSCH